MKMAEKEADIPVMKKAKIVTSAGCVCVRAFACLCEGGGGGRYPFRMTVTNHGRVAHYMDDSILVLLTTGVGREYSRCGWQ